MYLVAIVAEQVAFVKLIGAVAASEIDLALQHVHKLDVLVIVERVVFYLHDTDLKRKVV
jgi:hypothetical protein